ncbi:MAG: LysE family translocator [Allobranchiibius sp.]
MIAAAFQFIWFNPWVPSSNQWIAYLIASFLFIQLPGPSLLFTIGRALTVGRKDALLSVVGNGIGLWAQVLLVVLGLGALVAASATLYSVVKVLGAGYVIWLGVQAIRHRDQARKALDAEFTARGHSLQIGFLVGMTNPKTILFFVAFLPQFTAPAADHVGTQMMILGSVFAAMAICSDGLWAMLAGKARDWFARDPKRLDTVSGTGGVLMVGLGAFLLASES